jgi:hypothetical protein
MGVSSRADVIPSLAVLQAERGASLSEAEGISRAANDDSQ